MGASKIISDSMLSIDLSLSAGTIDSCAISQQIPINVLLPKGTFTYCPIFIFP